MKNVIVIHTAFPGDLVLATPLFESLKRSDASLHVTLLTLPQNSVLYENNPFVDAVVTYDKRGRDRGVIAFLKLIRTLKSSGFDTALIPHPSVRSALLALLCGAKRRIGFSHRWCSFLYTDRVDACDVGHEVTRNLMLARAAGGEPDVSGPKLYPGELRSDSVRKLLGRSGITCDDPYIAIAPGSVWATKRWPSGKYKGLVGRLVKSFPIVLVGSEGDRKLCDEILAGERGNHDRPAVSTAGELDLLESATLIRDASVLVSGDSAPVHLASSVGTPVVVIFGPTVPGFGFSPFGVPHVIVEKNLPCRPCSDHGPNRCPLTHFRCMRDIEERDVEQAVHDLLTMIERDRGRYDVSVDR